MLIHRPDCAEEAFHVIYRDLFAPIWSQKCVISENPHIGLTEHKTDDGAIAVLINYSSVPQPTRLCLHESFVVDKALYGSTDEIPACDALILKLRPNA